MFVRAAVLEFQKFLALGSLTEILVISSSFGKYPFGQNISLKIPLTVSNVKQPFPIFFKDLDARISFAFKTKTTYSSRQRNLLKSSHHHTYIKDVSEWNHHRLLLSLRCHGICQKVDRVIRRWINLINETLSKWTRVSEIDGTSLLPSPGVCLRGHHQSDN